MHLSKYPNVFAEIAKCICPNDKTYLSKLQNVFDCDPETSTFPGAITSCYWLVAGNGWRTLLARLLPPKHESIPY